MPTVSGAGAASQIERRRTRRYAFRAALELEWGSALLQGRVRDVSDHGMFIETHDPLWIGASFLARLMLPEPLNVECAVRRVEPGRGMAVTFVVDEPRGRAQWVALLGVLAGK